MRTFVGVIAGLGLVAAAAVGQPPRERAATLRPPEPIQPGDLPVARGAEDFPPSSISSTPVARPASKDGGRGPAWLTASDPNVFPAAGVGGTAGKAAAVRPLSSNTADPKDDPYLSPKVLDRLKGATRPPAAAPKADEQPTASTPFRGTSASGATVYAGPPAWRWNGWGAPTPGANPLAPAGQYPKASAAWYSITGATPGAVPVPVTNPPRNPPGTEPPNYTTARTPAPPVVAASGQPLAEPAPQPAAQPRLQPAERTEPPKFNPTGESKFAPPGASAPLPLSVPQLTPPPFPNPVALSPLAPPALPPVVAPPIPVTPPKAEPVAALPPVVAPPADVVPPPTLPPVPAPVAPAVEVPKPVTADVPSPLPISVMSEAPKPVEAKPVEAKPVEVKPPEPRREEHKWQPAAEPAHPAPGTWAPTGGRPTAPPAAEVPAWQSGSGAKAVIARGQAPEPTLDPVAQVVKQVCHGRADGVDVRWAGTKKLMVCFEVRTAAEAQRLVTDISRRPELAPYQIDFCAVVK